jgi:hypothetical protein
MIRVALPPHLRTLSKVDGEVQVGVDGEVTINSILDALEEAYPVLRGAIRDYATRKRRDLVRFFACGEDISNAPMTDPLPAAIASGSEPFLIIGAIAGG